MNDEIRYPPSYFNDSSMNKVFSEKEVKILIMRKTEESSDVYKNFYSDLSLYLSKLPSDNVKKFVTELSNRNQIYIGVSTVKDDGVFVRVVVLNDKLIGIVLDSADLEINIKTGFSNKIDDCIYASYFGLLRAATVLNKTDIKQDKELHKYLYNYIYLIFLKSLGKTSVYTQKQKLYIQIVCMYAFYKHFLKERHTYIKKIIHDAFKKTPNYEAYEEFAERLDNLEKYNDIRDIPKMFIDSKALIENPNKVILDLLKNLKTSGFYCFTGPLDQLIGLIVLSKYPTSLFSKDCLVNEDIHNNIENIMSKYISHIKFETSTIV